MFTVGADPELMLVNKQRHLVSAIPVLKGTKYEPLIYPHGNTMHDNVNAEFAINPVKTIDDFTDYVYRMLRNIKTEAGELTLVAIPSANYPESELQCNEARQFGCDPDFDAWLLERNSIPLGAAYSPFRTCGGHIHVGFKDIEFEKDEGLSGVKMVKIMDCVHGIASVLLDKFVDSKKRRNLYGKAGCFRAKPYGVEYRTLSNFWIGTPELTRLIYTLTEKCVEIFQNDKNPSANDKGHPIQPNLIRRLGVKRVVNTINTSNVTEAHAILYEMRRVLGKPLYDKIIEFSKKSSKKNREIERAWFE